MSRSNKHIKAYKYHKLNKKVSQKTRELGHDMYSMIADHMSSNYREIVDTKWGDDVSNRHGNNRKHYARMKVKARRAAKRKLKHEIEWYE